MSVRFITTTTTLSSQPAAPSASCKVDAEASPSPPHPRKSILKNSCTEEEYNTIKERIRLQDSRISRLVSGADRNIALTISNDTTTDHVVASQLWIDANNNDKICFRTFWSIFSHQELDIQDIVSLDIGTSLSHHLNDQAASTPTGGILWKSSFGSSHLALRMGLSTGVTVTFQFQDMEQLEAWALGLNELCGCLLGWGITPDDIRDEIESVQTCYFLHKTNAMVTMHEASLCLSMNSFF
eukprot:TRINITY_DN7960_c0_g1_i1.p1 TRINITY_DN7960_c0_g1~~TRINITY_DN7960_c0_g1_i1.p1  ORF type:complete len:251 (-),score=30.10 TRINITY_DN7960_c0_g1_i1:62-781(-)